MVLRYNSPRAERRRVRDSHPLWRGFPAASASRSVDLYSLNELAPAPLLPYNPARDPLRNPNRFGLFPVRSPLLRESLLMSLPRGTEMFQFPRCPSLRLYIQRRIRALAHAWVAPFGFAWIIARLQLPRHVSPVSASFFGPWPRRHPPYTLPRLACPYLYGALRTPSSFGSSVKFSYSLRQNRSKSSVTTSIVSRRLIQGGAGLLTTVLVHLILRLFRCCSPLSHRRYGRRVASRNAHAIRRSGPYG